MVLGWSGIALRQIRPRKAENSPGEGVIPYRLDRCMCCSQGHAGFLIKPFWSELKKETDLQEEVKRRITTPYCHSRQGHFGIVYGMVFCTLVSNGCVCYFY